MRRRRRWLHSGLPAPPWSRCACESSGARSAVSCSARRRGSIGRRSGAARLGRIPPSPQRFPKVASVSDDSLDDWGVEAVVDCSHGPETGHFNREPLGARSRFPLPAMVYSSDYSDLYRSVVQLCGLSELIGPGAVQRALRRINVDQKDASPRDYLNVLPELEARIAAYRGPADAQRAARDIVRFLESKGSGKKG